VEYKNQIPVKLIASVTSPGGNDQITKNFLSQKQDQDTEPRVLAQAYR